MKLPGQYPRWADFLAFLFWNGLFTQALGAEPRFWVVTETRHVLRSESPGNLGEARLSLARNEWGSFQILVRAEAPIRGLSLQAKLTGPDGRPTDAIEDYDYLALLEHRGQASEADAIVAPLAGSFFAWDKNPVAYERARTALATLILAGPKRR